MSDDRVTLKTGGKVASFTPKQFWDRVIQTPDGCWFWTGQFSTGGYGHLSVRRCGVSGSSPVTLRATRMAWALLVGPVREDLELDHLCRNRACVNPAHLEPVTHVENMRRMRESAT